MWVDSSHRRSTIAAEGGIRAAGATDPPVNDASEKEKEGCGLGPMMERSRVFSAGAAGPPAVTANIVSDESYKAMNRSASSSSPVQDDAALITNPCTGLVSRIFPRTNSDSSMASGHSLRVYSSSVSICDLFPPNLAASSTAPSDEDSLPPYRRPGTIDSEEYSTVFRKTLNLDKDASLVGSRDRQSFTEDRDSGYLLSQDSGYLLSQGSGTAAEDDLDCMLFFNNDISQSISSIFPPAELLPANVTTSNVESTSNPSQLYGGEVAKEMTNSGLITEHSSCNNGSIPSACDEDEILSPESSEASSESLVNTSEGNHEVKSHHVPEIGMKFSCEEEALKFYKKYAMEMGFKVRKGKVQRLADKSVAKRYFYCSKEGFRSKKQPTNMRKYTRKETRTGCNAMIQIKFKNKECSISHFISDHNHALKGSTEKCYIDSCSKIPEADSLIQPICGIEVAKGAEASACARFCDMSYGKHLHAKKSNILQPEDAQGLIDYLKKLQVEDLSLFYTFQVDAKSHMTNFFWRDSRSKIDYYYFGDVLILDTTFKTDRYNMICAPFLGLNHHRRHVLFGCAFLLDESVESFTWLLGTFMEAMGRRQPKTIFTTECQAIAQAVELTLPKSQHLLCKQLVCQNAKHLSIYSEQPKFESHFHSCLFDCQSEEEFQSMWRSLLEQYNLHENPWFQNMYTLRSKWSYLFSKITFCAGIHSNQGSENFSNANIFQNRESEAMTLPDYVLKYEKAAEQQRMEELEDDSFCTEPKSVLISTPMYIQAENVYTPTMLEIFRREFIESISVPLKRVTRTGSIVTYKVTKGGKIECMVEFNSSDSTITCSCKKFESVGILCAHAVKVLSTRNIFQIPSQYILQRWTKFAKDGVVEDGQNGEEIADNSESLCKSKFMDKALNVITKSVAVKKTRKIVERHLDIALKEVDDVLKKGSEHHNTKDAEVYHEVVRNTSSVARVGWKEKVLKAFHLNQGETSKGKMESQIQKKRKSEVKEKMNLPSSSMSLT